MLRESEAKISKMEKSAQQMADNYNAMLQKVVDSKSLTDPNTGKPYLPDETLVGILEDTFAKLEDGLDEEKTTNQGLITNQYDRVVECNTVKTNAFAATPDGVDAKAAAMEAAKTEHNNCRDIEITKENDATTKENAFNSEVGTCGSTEYQYYVDFKNTANQGQSGSLQKIIDAADLAAKAIIARDDHATSCDGLQTTFEAAFCGYSHKLETVCSEYGQCRDMTEADYATVKTSVQSLEASQKILLKMLRKVQCYIQVLENASESNMPTQANITDCSDLGKPGKEIDTSKLNIEYTPYPARATCDLSPVSHKPGTGNFAGTEYTDARHTGRVEGVTACNY